jgi:hypothetical protein
VLGVCVCLKFEDSYFTPVRSRRRCNVPVVATLQQPTQSCFSRYGVLTRWQINQNSVRRGMNQRLLRQYYPDSGSSVSTMFVHCYDSPVITLVVVANPFRGCSQRRTSPPLQFGLAALAFERDSFVTISTRVFESRFTLL